MYLTGITEICQTLSMQQPTTYFGNVIIEIWIFSQLTLMPSQRHKAVHPFWHLWVEAGAGGTVRTMRLEKEIRYPFFVVDPLYKMAGFLAEKRPQKGSSYPTRSPEHLFGVSQSISTLPLVNSLWHRTPALSSKAASTCKGDTYGHCQILSHISSSYSAYVSSSHPSHYSLHMPVTHRHAHNTSLSCI